MFTLDVSTHGSRLGCNGGRLMVEPPDRPPVGVPVEDIDLVVLEVPAVAVTGAALAALAEAGVPAMICDHSHRPIGWFHPVGVQPCFATERASKQAGMPQRTRDRLWAQLVRSKIGRQAEVLAEAGGREPRLRQLVRQVKPGDPSNVEATAAQIYWPDLFGPDFRRQGENPESHALNYGYAVLRGIVCRALVASGLHPGLGLHHSASGNPFALADDLIEPFRPLVDRAVLRLGRPLPAMPRVKAAMACMGEAACLAEGQRQRCRAAVQAAVASLVRVVDDGTGRLVLPDALAEPPDA